jgi:hypothetical protein
MWIFLTSATPADYVLFSLDDGPPISNIIAAGRHVAALGIGNNVGDIDVRTHAQLLNTWTWIALTSDATTFTAFWSTDGTLNNAGSVASSAFTPTGLFVNTDSEADGPFTGLIYNVKFWNTALSTLQLQNEIMRSMPRVAPPNTTLPFLNATNAGVDFSGSGHDMTVAGTLTTSTNSPRVPWIG